MHLATLALLLACPQDFGNLGGDAARSGSSPVVGPRAATPLWAAGNGPVDAGAFPVIAGGVVYAARRYGDPTATDPMDEIEARDLETGAVLWTAQVPWSGPHGTQTRGWIAGVRNDTVYALRNGPVHAFDAATGAFLWTSSGFGSAAEADGAVFAPNGDLVVADYAGVARIDGATGATVWVGGRADGAAGLPTGVGAAISGDAVYIDEEYPFLGARLVRLDLATGVRDYIAAAPTYASSIWNAPFCTPDGTVLLPLASPGGGTLIAYEDDGTAFHELWSFPIALSRHHQHGVGPDGSIYTFDRDGRIVRLDPATGTVLDTGPQLLIPGLENEPITVVDAAGNVFVSNGRTGDAGSNEGRLWCLSPDLSRLHFELVTDAPGRGGPALGGDGVLAVMDANGVRAYRETEIGTALCTSIAPNSTGAFGETVARGSAVAVDDRLHLTARNLPTGSFGYFLTSQTFDPLTTGGGNPNFCLAGSIGRYATSVQNTGPFGRFFQIVDLTSIPQPTGAVPGLAGQTWYFQSWHRDAVAGAATFDFSHVVGVTLQ